MLREYAGSSTEQPWDVLFQSSGYPRAQSLVWGRSPRTPFVASLGATQMLSGMHIVSSMQWHAYKRPCVEFSAKWTNLLHHFCCVVEEEAQQSLWVHWDTITSSTSWTISVIFNVSPLNWSVLVNNCLSTDRNWYECKGATASVGLLFESHDFFSQWKSSCSVPYTYTRSRQQSKSRPEMSITEQKQQLPATVGLISSTNFKAVKVKHLL